MSVPESRPVFLTWAETAEAVNKNVRWVKRHVYEFGDFESALIGNERMILRSSVEAYVAGKTAEGRLAAQASRVRREARLAVGADRG